MTQRPFTCELIVSPKLPVILLRDFFIVRSRIKYGVVIFGPGFLSMSSIMVDPKSEHLLNEYFDFKNLRLNPEWEGKTFMILLENVICCSLLTCSDGLPVKSGTSAFEVMESTLAFPLQSNLMTYMVEEKFEKHKIHPQRDWQKPPIIKPDLSEEFSLVSGTSRSHTAIFGRQSGPSGSMVSTSIEVSGVNFAVAELNTIEGTVYLLANDASILMDVLTYVEICVDIAKRHNCFVTVWGFSRINFAKDQFAIQVTSKNDLSASIFTSLGPHLKKNYGDHRAMVIKDLLYKPQISKNLSSETPASLKQEKKSSIDTSMMPENKLLPASLPQGPIIGHIVHTHIVKYEISGNLMGLQTPCIPKLDDSVMTTLSEQLLQTVLIQPSQPNKRKEVAPDDEISTMKEAEPLHDHKSGFEPSKPISHGGYSTFHHTNARKKRGRKPINEEFYTEKHLPSFTRNAPTNYEIDVMQQILFTGQKKGSISDSFTKQMNDSKTFEDDKGFTVNPFLRSRHLEMRTPGKEEFKISSIKQHPPQEGESGKCSSKKPTIPQQNFLEDKISQDHPQSKHQKTQQIIKDFSQNTQDLPTNWTEEVISRKKTKLKTSACVFVMPDQDLQPHTYSESQIKEAINYFNDL